MATFISGMSKPISNMELKQIYIMLLQKYIRKTSICLYPLKEIGQLTSSCSRSLLQTMKKENACICSRLSLSILSDTAPQEAGLYKMIHAGSGRVSLFSIVRVMVLSLKEKEVVDNIH